MIVHNLAWRREVLETYQFFRWFWTIFQMIFYFLIQLPATGALWQTWLKLTRKWERSAIRHWYAWDNLRKISSSIQVITRKSRIVEIWNDFMVEQKRSSTFVAKSPTFLINLATQLPEFVSCCLDLLTGPFRSKWGPICEFENKEVKTKKN